MEFAQEALKLNKELGKKEGIANNLINIGTILKNQKKYAKALDYCKKGLKQSEDIGALENEKNACKCLYDAYKALGKGAQALLYLERKQVIEDSLKANETAEELQQMEFKKIMYEDSIAKAEEAQLVQEAHLEEVRKKNQTRNILIGASLLLLVLAGALYGRWRFVRKTKNIIEKEKVKSDNLLLNILPADIAEELKQTGKAKARNFEQVSILFTDFLGFPEESAKLNAAQRVEEINHCFEAFDAIIEKHGIEKIKTIADSYMAAGGLPVVSESSIKNTVLAALEMQDFIELRIAKNLAEDNPTFEMLVGIHTGPIVAGIVGNKKFQYDVWGDTVNTASRIQSNGSAGKVNISQATYEFLKADADFAFESRGKIEAKGKGEINMYFVSKTK
jgi:class 3 adenylate cyclase